jgi:hypothetical protein
VQIFEDLLRDAAKNRGGDLSTLVEPDGGIEDDRDYDLWIVDGGESREGANVFRL